MPMHRAIVSILRHHGQQCGRVACLSTVQGRLEESATSRWSHTSAHTRHCAAVLPQPRHVLGQPMCTIVRHPVSASTYPPYTPGVMVGGRAAHTPAKNQESAHSNGEAAAAPVSSEGSEERSVELYRSPGAGYVGNLKRISITASFLSTFVLPVAAFYAPTAIPAAGKALLAGAVATVAVSTTGLLTLLTRSYVHSIRCTPHDAAVLAASASAGSSGDTPRQAAVLAPDVTLDVRTFTVLGGIRVNTVRAREIEWPQGTLGFVSFAAGGNEFFVHQQVVAADPVLRALFPPLATGESGPTPFIMVAQAGLEDEVNMLLKMGADVNQAAGDGGTALFVAAEHGQASMVRTLLGAKADVDKARPLDGATPLMAAASNGHADIVRTLAEAKASVNAARASDGATALYLAAQAGHTATVEALLEVGADANLGRAGDAQQTPLKIAEEGGHDAVAAVLRGAAGAAN
eukprot:m.9622 g.9622  ORF g.9622 m.9622 type:complete len:461 (+) comp2656_c0_seq1:96-1478(+)